MKLFKLKVIGILKIVIWIIEIKILILSEYLIFEIKGSIVIKIHG